MAVEKVLGSDVLPWERHPIIITRPEIGYKSASIEQGSAEDVVDYLKRLGIRGPEEELLGRIKDVASWANFELLEANGEVIMRVNRDDGTITQAHLSHRLEEWSIMDVYVSVGVKKEETREASYNTEYDGTFPNITKIESGARFGGQEPYKREYIRFLGNSADEETQIFIGIDDKGKAKSGFRKKR